MERDHTTYQSKLCMVRKHQSSACMALHHPGDLAFRLAKVGKSLLWIDSYWRDNRKVCIETSELFNRHLSVTRGSILGKLSPDQY